MGKKLRYILLSFSVVLAIFVFALLWQVRPDFDSSVLDEARDRQDAQLVNVNQPLETSTSARAENEAIISEVVERVESDDEFVSSLSSSAEERAKAYIDSFKVARLVVMQGGQGSTKHWAFNDPVKRAGKYSKTPPSAEEYLRLPTRVVDLHPITLIQNARTSGGGMVQNVPTKAVTVGPRETMLAEEISIWHPGHHDNPFGMRLSAYMISNKISDSSVPMSLLSAHPNVRFSFLRSGFGSCGVEMH